MDDLTPAERQDLAMRHRAFARVVARPFRSCLPRLAEDIESAAVLGLFTAARRFDPSRGALFTTFARRVVLGAIRDEIGRARLREVPTESAEMLRACDSTAESAALEAEGTERILESFAPSVRELIRLHVVEDVSYAELGARIGKSPAAVKQRVWSAIQATHRPPAPAFAS